MNDSHHESQNWIDIYQYFQTGGSTKFLFTFLTNLFICILVSFLPIFFFGCCQWNKLDTAKSISNFILPIFEGWKKTPIFWKFCSIIFSISIIFRIFNFFRKLPNIISENKYYEKKLSIPDSDLSTTKWKGIVQGVIVSDASNRMSLLEIAQQILCYENYLSSIVSDPTILIWKLPWLETSEHFFLSRNFLNLFKYSVTGIVLDEQGRSLVNDESSKNHRSDEILNQKVITKLERKFRLIGILIFIFSPFLFCYKLLYLFSHYTRVFKDNPTLSLRRWTLRAKYTFREYNEFPHVFKKRLAQSYNAANQYLKHFQSKHWVRFTKVVYFLSCIFSFLIISISIFGDSSSVLSLHLIGFLSHKTVLWLLIILLSTAYISRPRVNPRNELLSNIQNDEIDDETSPEDLLRNVERYIHYSFCEPTETAFSKKTIKTFSQFFVPIWKEILCELFSPLLNGVIFTFVLPYRAKTIIHFISHNSTKTNFGWISTFSTFNNRAAPREQQEKVDRSKANFGRSTEEIDDKITRNASILDFQTEISTEPQASSPIVFTSFDDIPFETPEQNPLINV